jgi:hypothetical protein
MSNPLATSDVEERTTTPRFTTIRIAAYVLGAVGIITSVIAGINTEPPTLWGLLPIVLFAALVVLGLGMIEATVFGAISALLVLMPATTEYVPIVVASAESQVTLIGIIIVLGGGVGEILRRTHVADMIVKVIVGAVGKRGRTMTSIAIMVACLVLVASLGTLAGALAIAAPLVIPVAARLGFTRSATASMMFIGGCAGLALAPFAGSNVAIMSAAGATYLQYLLYGALPLVIVSLVAGVVIVSWMQKRTEGTGDEYSAGESAAEVFTQTARSTGTTVFFLVALAISVAIAIATTSGIMFPIIALPILGILTGLVGGLGIVGTVTTFLKGAWSLRLMFVLFVLLAVFFVAFERLRAFDVILETYGDEIGGLSPFVFAIVIGLLGWVGIPGATAAQVVLLDQLFGEIGASLGITVGTWIIVLLFASKADTYGPFPNGNMVGAMGLARSTNMRNMLITGWAVLIPTCLVYLAIMFIQTR